MISLTIFQYIVCLLLPPHVIGKVLPFFDAFHFKKNIDLDYQSLSYALVHTSLIAKLTHLTLIVDAFLWFIIFFDIHPIIVCIVLLIICVQNLFFKEWYFSLFMLLIWSIIIATAFIIITVIHSPSIIFIAKFLLIVNAIIRFIGHVPEPIPPLILNNTDKFVFLNRKNFNAKILLLIPLGIISEFASGLPTRLFPVQVFIALQCLDFKPLKFTSWKKVKNTSQKIHQFGFKVFPETNKLYQSITKQV